MSQFCEKICALRVSKRPALKLVRPAIAVLIRTEYRKELDSVYTRMMDRRPPILPPDHEWIFCQLCEMYEMENDYDDGLEWKEFKSLQFVHIAAARKRDNQKKTSKNL